MAPDGLDLFPPPATPPKPSLRQSIDRAGIEAGIEAAKISHPAELDLEATTAEGGTVKLSLVGRWRFLQAAFWGSYSKQRGGGAGVEVVVPIGHRPILTEDPYPQPVDPSAPPRPPDPRYPGA